MSFGACPEEVVSASSYNLKKMQPSGSQIVELQLQGEIHTVVQIARARLHARTLVHDEPSVLYVMKPHDAVIRAREPGKPINQIVKGISSQGFQPYAISTDC